MTTLPEPTNLYVRAIIQSLARFWAKPRRLYVRAKKLEPELGIDRRVIGRSWMMLRKTGALEPYARGRNGHGGLVWEVDPERIFPALALVEALPYHADALVYEALGYPTLAARSRRRDYLSKDESSHDPAH